MEQVNVILLSEKLFDSQVAHSPKLHSVQAFLLHWMPNHLLIHTGRKFKFYIIRQDKLVSKELNVIL